MARFQLDIMSDADGDILLNDGDLVFGDGTRRHQQVIMMANEGEIRHEPLQGVGVGDWLLEDGDLLSLQHKIQAQFERDGLQVKLLNLGSFPTIKVEADYE